MLNERTKKHFGLLALLFPLVILAGITINAAHNRDHGGQVWQVPVTGYDPRDLLYGHYLSFRYQWDLEEAGAQNADCLCLHARDGGNMNPKAQPLQCRSGAARQCSSLLKVYRHGGSYSLNRDSGSDRYFIPERNARELEKLLRGKGAEFTMELRVRPGGSAAVRGLYIDGVKLEDYLRALPHSEKAAD